MSAGWIAFLIIMSYVLFICFLAYEYNKYKNKELYFSTIQYHLNDLVHYDGSVWRMAKELTIEEKAQAYDSIFERLKEMYNNNKTNVAERLKFERYFPELKSEDEKDKCMLKNIIDTLRPLSGTTHSGYAINSMIAWLEKQGEQKPAEEYNITGIGSKNAQGKLGKMIKNLKPVNEVLEQKPAENEELTEFDKAVGVSIGTWNPKTTEQIQSVKAVSKKLLKLAKKQINDEQNPAWSEEDEKMLNDAIGAVGIADYYTYDDKQEIENWLKSLKCRVQPQPKQEWSEEDEAVLDALTRRLEGEDIHVSPHLAVKCLKSLRLQSQWKPSDEQMAVLNEVINYAANSELQHWSNFIYTLLKSLREQLKKLK